MIEQFLADDIHFMFGNPGTVEQGFLDSLEQYPDFKYIMGLQETVALGIADGYARATKQPTIVQLHSGVGLGNGIGMMYQSMRGHAPLVVIAGEAGIKYDAMDAQMAADLGRHGEARDQVGDARRRSELAAARAAPGDQDRFDAADGSGVRLRPGGRARRRERRADFPDAQAGYARRADRASRSTRAADMLAGAQHPMIIVGDGIAYSRAQDELARVAETLGAEVWGADASEVNLPFNHPLWKGHAGAHVRRVEQQGHDQSRRRADRRHLRVPGSLPVF